MVKGFVGSYPNIFFQLPAAELGEFVAAIGAMRDEGDYTRLVGRYGVRRTSPRFWELSDALYEYYLESEPTEAGLFDLNRYENR